ncbi:isoprenylcysteine carboxylmethyltransferase family protein [Planktotalea sp.]|uniref:methyltransferase family protein n=1 Tax=Planktotalea sp. TaxID=2029877 RepID=UPI002600FAB8|nr:isoprenylcysteine carboxylmethyltransferase family protein [Planktotalea sp.]
MNKLPLTKLIDIPPIWLALFCALTWLQSVFLPLGLGFGGEWARFAGTVFIATGLILMLMAVTEMRKSRTTVIPHLSASALVTSGIFAQSRNPIYLGDVLVLIGLILRWDALLALAFVPVFIGVLMKRFIEHEEARLRQGFGDVFIEYCQSVRCWM